MPLRDVKYKRESLSARRAWIEIAFFMSCTPVCFVALRKESVDRNCHYRDDVSD